eukprot:1611823-Prymnesium_polylepis.1
MDGSDIHTSERTFTAADSVTWMDAFDHGAFESEDERHSVVMLPRSPTRQRAALTTVREFYPRFDHALTMTTHSMRARAASSPTRPWWRRSAMTSSWTGCIISLVPGRKAPTMVEVCAPARKAGSEAAQ